MHIVHLGDCRDVLASIADNSIDSIVTDPPYELGFMGKAWDASGIAYDVTVWRHCLRVLKPGGHLIAFGGSRTYHRMAVAIEDAGFEIRDQIQWIYGSGFPKSLAVDKAIDKQRDDREQVYAVTAWIRQVRDNAGLSNADIDKAFGFNGMAGHWTSSASQPSVPTLDQIPPLLDLFGLTLDDVPDDVRTLIWTLNGRKGQPGEAWEQREVTGKSTKARSTDTKIALPSNGKTIYKTWDLTAPATDLAKQWQGWGTALKPAHEPAVLARKPLCGTVADNVTTWGVGALNIDGTRIATDDVQYTDGKGNDTPKRSGAVYGFASYDNLHTRAHPHTSGRWPANVIFDQEAASLLGEPSRFFYVAKASKAEREAGLDIADGRANHHPTVKPIALMRYLVRMVTPKGGVVLDPFTGSGSTGCAAVIEGCDFVGMDITPEYVEIAQKRIAYYAVESPLLL